MKCKVCEEFYLETVNYNSIFNFPNLCKKCQNKYLLKVKKDAFPTDGKIIRYYYFYNIFDIDANKITYLILETDQIRKTLEKLAKKNTTLIIIDDYIFNDLPNWFTLIKPFNNLTFLSIEFYDFSKFYKFF